MGPCFFLVTWNPDNQSWDELFDEGVSGNQKGVHLVRQLEP